MMVGAHEKEQLLGALGPMKSDIVEKKLPEMTSGYLEEVFLMASSSAWRSAIRRN